MNVLYLGEFSLPPVAHFKSPELYCRYVLGNTWLAVRARYILLAIPPFRLTGYAESSVWRVLLSPKLRGIVLRFRENPHVSEIGSLLGKSNVLWSSCVIPHPRVGLIVSIVLSKALQPPVSRILIGIIPIQKWLLIGGFLYTKLRCPISSFDCRQRRKTTLHNPTDGNPNRPNNRGGGFILEGDTLQTAAKLLRSKLHRGIVQKSSALSH